MHNALATVQRDGVVRTLTIWHSTITASALTVWLTLGALLIYAVVLFTAYQAYQLRPFSVTPTPQALLDNYLYEPEARTKAVLAATLADDYAQNEPKVAAKVFWTRGVLFSLMVEAAWLLLMAVIQVTL